MITLGELSKLGFSHGYRCRGLHLAKSLFAASAVANEFLKLQQTLRNRSSVLGELHRGHGTFHDLNARDQTDYNFSTIFDKGSRWPSCFKGKEQVLGFHGSRRLFGQESTSKVGAEILPKISGCYSHIAAHEQLIDRRKFPDDKKQEYPGQRFQPCGREGTDDAERNVQLYFCPRVRLRQELCDGSYVGNHVIAGNREKAVIQVNHPRVVTTKKKSRLRRKRVKKGTSCVKSESGGRSFGKLTHKPRHGKTVYTLNRQISFLMDTGYREEAYAVYEKILPDGYIPDSYTYLHMIKGFCEAGELSEAQDFFKEIFAGDGLFCSGSEVILYNAMVHGLGSAGFVKEALHLVEEMRGRGFTPDVYTYNSMLHSFGKVGKITEALGVFESMAVNGCAPDVVTYNSLMRCLCMAGRPMEAYKLYEGMIEEGCLPNLVTFNTLLPILGKTGELALAVKLYKYMTTMAFEPDVYTFTSLVTSLCRANKIDEALLLSVEMTQLACAPNTVTFNSWLDGLCKGGRVAEAHFLFQKMLALGYVPDNITYCILIDAFCGTGQFIEKSFDLFKDLLKCTIFLDCRTSDIVYQSFKKVGMLKQAKRIARNARAKQSRCAGLS